MTRGLSSRGVPGAFDSLMLVLRTLAALLSWLALLRFAVFRECGGAAHAVADKDTAVVTRL